MLLRNRRRDPRLELEALEARSCCLLDPLGFAPGIVGQLKNLSRGGAAVQLSAGALAALDPRHELLLNAALPSSNTRMKRAARVTEVRGEADGGAIVAFTWVVAAPADRYAQVQQARFNAELCKLLALTPTSSRGASRALDLMALLNERLEEDEVRTAAS